MNCLDSSFLIDYLEGDDGAQAWLDDHEDTMLATTTVALYETYRGVLWSHSSMTMDDVFDTFDWATVLDFDETAARESAQIQRELRESGTPVGTPDVMIGAIVRSIGGTVVTRDSDFDYIRGVDVENY
ncbi:type II toxin-antitoxin system VapC family toxin [Haladaptatus caseinilyticus]|uniref:type II toxin-antitoxin system VapC family toxin n=1 Tax=Haladaptatus caseinilyticus TaxID=2993314 RepID=UPI00224A9E85|nr:type II toxin-antitoxin system VapC family toxin [Haladaptatus caseinilyticus]